jgi:hypothetical protein
MEQQKHPLPWEVKVLMIVDAHGEQVFHHGGTTDRAGRRLEGDEIVELNHKIVNAVNDHAYLTKTLKAIASLWPENTSADILSVSGINDGRSRAILADAAVNLARQALATIHKHTPGDPSIFDIATSAIDRLELGNGLDYSQPKQPHATDDGTAR